ncbi:unnamed protein product [Mytilus coruscus]|uniref:Reverse transcriptase domain-containing protein n=1 Tax=Mytilus coruscus TaxID=42192 RepID=A0A6J8A7X5_MYTCO|nr:unnamed protein product [Mytilus coruscus]
MTEVTVHRTLREDEEMSTASSPKSSVAGDARDKMVESKSSRKTSSRRSKKKDEVEELNKKWESRFSQIESRFDNFFDLFSSNDGNINKDTVTSGEQRPCQNQSEQDSGSSGALRLVEDSNHEHFQTDSVRERENDDVVSLAPGHRERHDIGLLSEDESSLKSKTENPQKSSSRFSKYVKGNESDSDENNNDHLKTLFGDDVKTKKETSSGGLILDKSKIDILSGSWRCKNPERLTAYNDEYRHSFPVHEKTSDILEVPSLDNMVSDLLMKKHGAKAYAVSQKSNLYNPCLKSLEKLVSRPGKEVNLDKCIQLVRDIFAMSTKSLDQVARAGAFHHLIRRKATLEDTGLNDIKELKHPLVSLSLTKSGVLGDNMEQTLKDRVDKNKQLKELLPELHVNKFFRKRKATGNQFSNDWSKKLKFDNAQQGSTFTGAKSGTQRTVLRTNTVTRPDKDDKSSALPFGPTSAPRVFTKVVSVVAAHLRAQGIRLVVYLDDWFQVIQASLMLVQDREIVLNLLVKLGFIINLKKSFLTPTQKITYIGALFHLDLGIVMPTQERVLKLQKTVKEMKLKNHATARDFFTSTRNYGFLHRDDSLCKTSYETNSNLFAESLAPHFPKSGTKCSSYTISKISSDLVVRYSQHYKGQIFTTLGNSCDHNTRCFYIERLGRSHGFPDNPRDLVRYTENSTYQLYRVRSCTENNTTFSSSVEGEKCTFAMRQLDCCTIHKQTGGHQISSALSKNLGFVETPNRTQNSNKSSTHSRQSECVSRSSITDKNKTHGVVSSGDCSSTNICQALRFGDGNISVHSRGVYFIREGLSKQDRPGHFGTKIFVPAFDAEKLLDPKRALTYYLKSTDNFRSENRQDSKLFLAI